MDQLFVELLLLDEAAVIGIAFLLIILGGIAGAFLLKVKIALRRVSYLWFLAGSNLALMVAQLGWGLIPTAATAGLLSVLIVGVLSSFFFFGVGLYYASAARSNHIKGNTESAWLGFVPFANLWLMFKAGAATPELDVKPRSAFARFVADPLLVTGALVVFLLGQGLGKALEESTPYEAGASATLDALITRAQTLEESLAAEAAASSRELPIRVDEITVFRTIEASGNTLQMTFDVEKDIKEFNPGFKRIIAEQQCAPNMFAQDIARGAHIVFVYIAPNGRVIGKFDITQADCL